jgi:hypothetical protein
MVMLTTPLYLTSVEDREISRFFLLDQQIGPDPKLKSVSRCGLVISAITNPFKIGEAYEIQIATCCIVDPITDGALNVSEDALGNPSSVTHATPACT